MGKNNENGDTYENVSNHEIIRRFERCIVLETKDSGNGQNPFDKESLEKEILKRMESEKK